MCAETPRKCHSCVEGGVYPFFLGVGLTCSLTGDLLRTRVMRAVLVSFSTGTGRAIDAFLGMGLTCSLTGDLLRARVTRAVLVSFSTGARAATGFFFGEAPFFLGDTDGPLRVGTLEMAPVLGAGFFEGDPVPPAVTAPS
jgi:hypothetical protein